MVGLGSSFERVHLQRPSFPHRGKPDKSLQSPFEAHVPFAIAFAVVCEVGTVKEVVLESNHPISTNLETAR